MSTNPKDELMQACIKSGMSEADCRKKMTDAFPTPQSDADLMRERNMLRAENDSLKNKIKQATDLITRVNTEKDAAETTKKEMLIKEIVVDSAWSEDQLKNKSIAVLEEINTTLKLNNNKTFAAVAADLAEQDKKTKVHLSAGAWDAQKKEWVGGL